MIFDNCFVALAMWREPDSGLQSQTFDIRGETVHSTRETIIDGEPVAILTKTVTGALPAVVDLHVLNAEVF